MIEESAFIKAEAKALVEHELKKFDATLIEMKTKGPVRDWYVVFSESPGREVRIPYVDLYLYRVTEFFPDSTPPRIKTHKSPLSETLLKNYPLYWEIFGLCLPHKTRKEAFEPSYHEALVLHIKARQKFKSKKMRRILAVCFAFQTVWLVLGSFAELLKEKSVRLLCLFFPFLEKYFSRWRM